MQKAENLDVKTRGWSVTRANCKGWHVVLSYHLTAMDFSDFFYAIRIRGTVNIVLDMTCIACIVYVALEGTYLGGWHWAMPPPPL